MTTSDKQTSRASKPVLRIGLVLLIVVAGVVGGVYLVRNGEAENLAAGQTAVAAGDWALAIAALDQALAAQPAFLRQHVAEASALRGFAHYQQEAFAEALRDFDAALALVPDYVDLPAYQADIYYQQDDFDAALAAGDAALAQRELLPDYMLSRLRAQRTLMLLAESEPPAVVAAELEEALALQEFLPDETVARLMAEQALLAFAADEAETAMSALAQFRTLQVEPSEEIVARLQAAETAVLAQRDDDEATLAAADRALETAVGLSDETLVQLHLTRSNIFYEMDDLEAALSAADAAAAIDDSLALPHALRALEAYRSFDYETALAAAEDALALDDENSLAHRVQGTIYGWIGRDEESLVALNRALEHDPDDIEALAMRSYVHAWLDDYAAAEDDAELALELDPQSPASLWAQAGVHLDEDEVGPAYELLTQAIALDNSRPELYTWRTYCYRYTAEFDERAADLEAALALHPDFPPALVTQIRVKTEEYDFDGYEEMVLNLLEKYPELGVAHIEAAEYYSRMTDDLEQALAYADQAIELSPDSAYFYVTRGAIYRQMDDPELAVADFEMALELDPEFLGVHTVLVEYYMSFGEENIAFEYLEDAEEIASESLDDALMLAGAYAVVGRFDDAWPLLHDTLAVDPADVDALLLRSLIYGDSQQYTRAINDVSVVIAAYPDHAWAHSLRAQLMMEQGDFETAVEDANRALELDPYHLPGPHYVLAMSAWLQGDVEEAVPHLENYAAASGDGRAYLLHGSALLEQGLDEEALAVFDAGIELEDDFVDSMYLERAIAHELLQDEESARADLDTILQNGTDLAAIAQAEAELAYLDTLPASVDGRRTLVDEELGYTIAYADNWVQQPVDPEGIFALILTQEVDERNAAVILAMVDGATGLTSLDLADIITENYADTSSFESLSLDPFQFQDGSGYVRDYELTQITETGSPVVLRGRQYYLVVGDLAVFVTTEAELQIFDAMVAEFDAIVQSFALLP